MEAKKRSIHFSGKWLEELADLIDMLGLKGTYGAEARTLQFCTTFTLKMIPYLEKTTPPLNTEKLGVLFLSIAKIRHKAEKAERLKKEAESVGKVTPPDFKSMEKGG